MQKPIVKGSTVKYQNGYYRVTHRSTNFVNLGAIFHTNHIYHKRVPVGEVVEAHDEWYAKWQQSETYKSM